MDIHMSEEDSIKKRLLKQERNEESVEDDGSRIFRKFEPNHV